MHSFQVKTLKIQKHLKNKKSENSNPRDDAGLFKRNLKICETKEANIPEEV
jgi:hypothetical protein